MQRNPKWTRDELILALDLFFRVNPIHTSESHPEIVALSELLNQLPIHAKEATEKNFRNPNGVYMKLCNFLRFDPGYSGVGLSAGAKLDGIIWEEYAGNKAELSIIANRITENALLLSPPKTTEEEESQEQEEFTEGRILARMHNVRERNASLTKKKKKEVLARIGTLSCEACGFNFEIKYGQIGLGFCECHHNMPVSELRPGDKTKISELSILCANCHRMIHRTRPWLSVTALKSTILNDLFS